MPHYQIKREKSKISLVNAETKAFDKSPYLFMVTKQNGREKNFFNLMKVFL